MNDKPSFFLTTLICISLLSCHQDYALVLYSQDKDNDYYADVAEFGIVISDYKTEMMTQCPSAVYDNGGYVYVNYYCNPQQKKESPSNTTFCRLARFNICKPSEVVYIDLLKAHESVGEFVVGNYATYDPTMIIIGDYVYNLMIAVERDNPKNRGYVCRRVDKNTMRLEDCVTKLSFTYVVKGETITIPLFEEELSVYLDKKLGRQQYTSFFGRPALSLPQFFEGYYYSYLGGQGDKEHAGRGFPGVLVRSKDAINWEEVSIPSHLEKDYGITDILEGALAIQDGTVFVSLRSKRAPIIRYDIKTDSWTSLSYTFDDGNYSGARNFLYKRGDCILSFTNSKPNIQTISGSPIRTRLRISKIDSKSSVVNSIDIVSKYGLVYPVVFAAGSGEYMVCAENRRWSYQQETGNQFDPTYPCSDIVIIPLGFLDEI